MVVLDRFHCSGFVHRYTKNGIGNANRKLQELQADHVRLWQQNGIYRYLIKQFARERGGPQSSESAMFWNS